MAIPCQTYLKDGKLVQGTMDTTAKFNLMTSGIDLKDKQFLDVGCNNGMMTYLASQQGAIVKGIDISYDTIKYARSLYPNIPFFYEHAESISGNYDIILASAMLHYTDLDKVLCQFSRCTKQVICDIWLHPSEVPIFALTSRNIYIPSKSAFLNISNKYFQTIELKGNSLSPDDSQRFIFHLSNPIYLPPQAILISGKGNSGKTTLSSTFGLPTFQLDILTHEWFFYNREVLQSVFQSGALLRGSYKQHYLEFYKVHFLDWLHTKSNRDIVVEGYDLLLPDTKELILGLLSNWQIKEIQL